MNLITEIGNLDEFECWSGAYDTYSKICTANLGESFIQELERIYPHGLSPTELNDLLWFESDFCLSLVGLSNEVGEE